jgi:hypothetical protein
MLGGDVLDLCGGGADLGRGECIRIGDNIAQRIKKDDTGMISKFGKISKETPIQGGISVQSVVNGERGGVAQVD